MLKERQRRETIPLLGKKLPQFKRTVNSCAFFEEEEIGEKRERKSTQYLLTELQQHSSGSPFHFNFPEETGTLWASQSFVSIKIDAFTGLLASLKYITEIKYFKRLFHNSLFYPVANICTYIFQIITQAASMFCEKWFANLLVKNIRADSKKSVHQI